MATTAENTEEIEVHLVMAKDELAEAEIGIKAMKGPLSRVLLIGIAQARKTIAMVMTELEDGMRETRR